MSPTPPSGRWPVLRVLVAVCLFADAYLVHAMIAWMSPTEQAATPTAWALAGLIAVVGVAQLLRPSRWLLAAAQGIAVGMIVAAVVATYFAHVSASIGSGGGAAADRQAAIVFAVGVLPQLVILVATHVLAGATVAQTAGSALLGMFAISVLGWVVTIVILFATPLVDLAMTAPGFTADSVMKESVAKVQACAYRYAKEHPQRGYPPDLQTIGPAGTNCIDAKLASGRTGRVLVTYTPAPPDAAGRIPVFTVNAHVDAGPDGAAIAAFGDTSGILRAGPANANGAALPIQHGSLRLVREVRACAEVYRRRSANGSYPQRLFDLEFTTELTRREQDSLALLGCPARRYPRRPRSGTSIKPGLSYTPIGGNPVTEFAVEDRPYSYAVDGIRSYRAMSRGPVRVTKDDRSATDDDDLVPSCEYELGGNTCAPLPGGVVPSAVIVVDSMVRLGAAFRVAVRDLRAAGDADVPYQAAFECSHHGYDYGRHSPPPFSFKLEHDCVLARDSSLLSPERAIVRAWVRDVAGSMVILADTVRIQSPEWSR